MSFRIEVTNEKLALHAAHDAYDSPRVENVIRRELATNRDQLEGVDSSWYIGHGNNPSAQLVEGSLLHLGVLEFLEAHPPAVVGRSDLDECLARRSPPRWI